MNLTSERIPMEDLASVCLPHQSKGRSPGFHVTDLISESNLIAGKRPPNYTGLVGLGDMGKVVEWAIRPYLAKDALDSMGTLYTDVEAPVEGIVGNLDGLIHREMSDPKFTVVEVKLRFAADGDPRENERWMSQIQAYCYMYQTCSARLYVVSMPRTGPPSVHFTRHVLEFEHHEILATWTMLQNVKKYVEANGWTPRTRS